ncbi:hypothetical protein EF405_06230 [Cyclobacteriaceae bacterium YHN15]|jgi:hypothetical protein|nr:hypothetical protein EF405_06230 [Cyclobacteriaceae bacterium YHN15]
MEEIEKSSLRSLFWKDEILQVLYWMNGEGLGSKVKIAQVLALLNTNEANLLYQISKLVDEDVLLASSPEINKYTEIQLSTETKKEAGRRFADAFQGYQKAGHGECGPDCEFCYGPDGHKLDNCVHNCATAH